MTGTRGVLFHWDPEIDGGFRRRLESALDTLQVAFADAAEIDADPDAPLPVSVAVISAAGRFAGPRTADITLLAGPGDAPSVAGALRIETTDIEQASRRWIAVLEKVGARLDRGGLGKYPAASADIDTLRGWALAFPADPLAQDAAIGLRPDVLQAQLAAERARAETAERSLADLERDHQTALKQGQQSDRAAGIERDRLTDLRHEIGRLTALSESTAFALSSVRADSREAVRQARDHAWQARLAAARADGEAAAHPDALVWPKAGATYSGETRNRQPHGYGVMVFRDGAEITATYRGAFVDGARAGHGTAMSDSGQVWAGQWAGGEASGYGLLETPDGRRFEGNVKPDADGAPQRTHGWTWASTPTQQPTPAATVHTPLAPLLPAPGARPQGG